MLGFVYLEESTSMDSGTAEPPENTCQRNFMVLSPEYADFIKPLGVVCRGDSSAKLVFEQITGIPLHENIFVIIVAHCSTLHFS